MKNPGVMFIGVGFELFALVLGGIYVGQTLDEYYNLGGWGEKLILGAVMLSWSFHFYVLIRRYMRYLDQDENEQN